MNTGDHTYTVILVVLIINLRTYYVAQNIAASYTYYRSSVMTIRILLSRDFNISFFPPLKKCYRCEKHTICKLNTKQPNEERSLTLGYSIILFDRRKMYLLKIYFRTSVRKPRQTPNGDMCRTHAHNACVPEFRINNHRSSSN